jgi:hypothetical protein
MAMSGGARRANAWEKRDMLTTFNRAGDAGPAIRRATRVGWIASRVAVLVLGAALTACGAGPTSPSPALGSNGAVISGSVMGLTSGSTAAVRQNSSFMAATASEGLTVTVAGTSISATMSSTNAFVLENVPAGDVTLIFTGPGFDARVTLSNVQQSENIEITVSVEGDTVAVQSERRSQGGEVQLEGRIESLPPTSAPNTLVVAGQTVTTDGNTRVVLGSATKSFADLAIGYRVHVKGTVSGSSLLASIIAIQNVNADLPVNLTGIVDELTGTSADFRFEVDGRQVRGDASTEFFGGSKYGDLKEGVRVEVKGLQRDGYVYAARIHVSVDDEDDDDAVQDSSASIEGPLTAMSGSGSTRTLTIDGTTVTTNAATEVRRRGDTQPLSVLQVGMIIHVVGTRQSDGSIVARMLQIKDDEAGDTLEIHGSMGGVKGSCPSLQFSINGYAITTNGSTTFTPACGSQFKSGAKATVVGVVQAGGSVLATSVTLD